MTLNLTKSKHSLSHTFSLLKMGHSLTVFPYSGLLYMGKIWVILWQVAYDRICQLSPKPTAGSTIANERLLSGQLSNKFGQVIALQALSLLVCNGRIKSVPIFPQSLPKRRHSRIYLKVIFFKIAQKLANHLGHSRQKVNHRDLSNLLNLVTLIVAPNVSSKLSPPVFTFLPPNTLFTLAKLFVERIFLRSDSSSIVKLFMSEKTINKDWPFP